MEANPHYNVVKLLFGVTRLHKARLDEAVEAQFGLNRSQAMLLLRLGRADGPTHSDIAAQLEVSPAAATKIIKHMEQEGYVRRQADPTDERVSRVLLLDRGRAAIAMIVRAFGELDRQLFAGLSEAELAQLGVLLERMHANQCGRGKGEASVA